MQKICVLGAGSWGTAQAILLAESVGTVFLWGRIEDGIEKIALEHENTRYLPGVALPDNVQVTSDMKEALKDAEIVVMAVPSQAVRQVSQDMSGYLSGHEILVNTAKGLEIESGKRLSQVVEEILGKEIVSRFAVVSGPSHAEEVGRKVPTVVTVAALSKETAFLVQDVYMTPYFRVYTNPDVAGVELGGALKNIIALATGIVHGIGYGDNTKAALITRGLAEMIRMGEKMGGNPRTFSGLSGIGDLVVTCGSTYSRNRRAGEMLGKGYSLEETLHKIGMVVEGIHTTRVVHQLAEYMDIDMPITDACYKVLYESRDPQYELSKIMLRKKKHEIEEIAINRSDW